MEDVQNVNWSHCYGWPTQMKDGLIMMGDLPKWTMEKIWIGLIVMGDLPKCKMVSLWWVTYPNKNMENGLIVMGDLPRKRWWWKTKGGLIIMGDLPKKKMMVSLWWVTYPNGKCKVVSLLWVTYPENDERWSHYNGRPTQMEDDVLIMMGDLPRKIMMVSLWWVTYPDDKMWLTWQKDLAGEVLTG
jgi:hypothetical protein